MRFLEDRNNNLDPHRKSRAKLTSATGAVVLAAAEVLSYLDIDVEIPEKLLWSAAFATLYFIRRAI